MLRMRHGRRELAKRRWSRVLGGVTAPLSSMGPCPKNCFIKSVEIAHIVYISVYFCVTIKAKRLRIAVYGKPIAELQSVTCHVGLGSHSLSCHPTQCNTSRHNPQAILDLPTPKGGKS